METIAGVLPLTFTARGGNAVDWMIYGNDENGTENLFDVDDYFVKAYVKSNVTFTKSGNDLKITATDTNDPYVNGSVGNGSSLNEAFRNGLMPVQAGDTLTFSCTTSAPPHFRMNLTAIKSPLPFHRRVSPTRPLTFTSATVH